MKKLYLTISLLALVAMSGCVNKQEVDTLNYQLSMEQQQRILMEKKIRALEEQLGKTDSSLREEISQSSQPVRFNQANMTEEMRALKTELARVQGTLEEVNRRTQMLEQTTTEDNQKISRLTSREKELRQELVQISSQLALEKTLSPRKKKSTCLSCSDNSQKAADSCIKTFLRAGKTGSKTFFFPGLV